MCEEERCRPACPKIRENYFSNFSTKTYFVGSQKNRLDETILLEHPKHMFTLMGKKIITILRKMLCLTGSMDQFVHLHSFIGTFVILYLECKLYTIVLVLLHGNFFSILVSFCSRGGLTKPYMYIVASPRKFSCNMGQNNEPFKRSVYLYNFLSFFLHSFTDHVGTHHNSLSGSFEVL